MSTSQDRLSNGGHPGSSASESESTQDWNPHEWLPPQYHNPDYRPPLRAATSGDEAPLVILPTSEGGFKPVSNRIVHVEYQGQQIPLVVLTRRQRIWRRVLFNLIAAIVSLIVLALVFWWAVK